MRFSFAHRVIAIALVILYAVGLAFLLFGKIQVGLALWVISTAGGLLMLFVLKNREDKDRSRQSSKPKE